MKKKFALVLSLFLLTGCISNQLVGKYVADELQDVLITADRGQDNINPYYLELKKDKTFILEIGEDTITGSYQVDEDKITMQQNDGIVWACDIEEDNNLSCDLYSSQFIKQE